MADIKINNISSTYYLIAIIASGLAIIVHALALINPLINRIDNDIELSLTEPQNNSNLEGNTYAISGHIKSNQNGQLKNFKIIPLVQVIKDGNWWVQPKPLVNQSNGNFKGTVFIGNQHGSGVSEVFHITVIAIPSGQELKLGDKLLEPPALIAASDIITIRRIR